MLERWMKRPVTVLACLLMLVAVAGFFLSRVAIGPATAEGASWDVVIEHFGLDPPEIERSITNPLEDALTAVGGIREMRSVSEAGKARIILQADPDTDPDSCYLEIRDAVDRVWRQLPGSVQKPRITSASQRQGPVFIVALSDGSRSENELRQWVDRHLKPEFEKLPGSGEVEVGGGAAGELHVLIDEARAAAAGVAPGLVAGALQTQHVLAAGGSVAAGGFRVPLVVDGRFRDAEDLGELRLAGARGAVVRLAELAAVTRAGRETDSVSRLDNQRLVTVHVRAGGTANLISLSRALRALCAGLPAQGLEPRIILDTGRQLEESVNSLLWALAEGVLVVVLLLPLFLSSLRRVAGVALALPLVVLFSLAGLGAAGISIDRFILAGMAVGLGNILDTFIIIAEQPDLRRASRILPSLLASLVTLLIVLLPLCLLDPSQAGPRDIARAVCLLLVMSLATGALFVPFLCGLAAEPAPARTVRAGGFHPLLRGRFHRWGRRQIGHAVLFSARRPWAVLVTVLVLSGLAMVRSLGLGTDFSAAGEEGTISVHVECAAEATVEDVDRRCCRLGELFAAEPGVVSVETLARPGNARMNIVFDPKRRGRAELAECLRQIGGGVRGVFVYLPDSGATREIVLEIGLGGSDDGRLRALAGECARSLKQADFVSQVVLNFKEAPHALQMAVDPELAARSGQSARSVAEFLRWSLYGPVALKWLDRTGGAGRGLSGEIDLRIRGRHPELSRAALLDLPLTSAADGTAGLRLGSVANLGGLPGGARIYHQNRQRTVFLTVHCRLGSVEDAQRRLWQVLDRQVLPKGYAFAIDRRAQELEDSFRRMWILFLVGLALIYLVLAAQSQSLTGPLAVLAVIPPAVALPLFIHSLGGEALRLPVVFGLIVLAGVAVNTSILVCDRLRGIGRTGRQASYSAIRHCSRALTVTLAATLVGSLPLLLAQGGGNSFLPALSLVIMWGVIGSYLGSLTVIPALLAVFPRLALPVRRRGFEESS